MPNRMSDVIVVLPGITGSVLKQHGDIVWGYGASTIAKALFTGGSHLTTSLALPHDDPSIEDLGDGIAASDLMPDLHLLPGVWKIDGYSKIIEAIKQAFEVTEGKNFFRFPYDWRRDNRVAAQRLARSAHGWLSAWRAASGNSSAKLILIAHSMGGLVARYFLECLEGWKSTKSLITFGTPYRGSLNALDGLSNGVKKGPLDLSSLTRQFTAMYQLLPIYECYLEDTGKMVRVAEAAAIPNIDAHKAAAALAFHREIEASVSANQKLSAYQQAGYRIHPIVGIAQETHLSAQLVNGKVQMLTTFNGQAQGGDGTVPRVSAIPIELSASPSSAMYAGTRHGSLQNAEAATVQLIGILTGSDLDLGQYRTAPLHVSLAIQDVYDTIEPITVRARTARPLSSLTCALWRPRERTPMATTTLKVTHGDWLTGQLPPQAPGAYRVRISSPEVEPAEDAFVVADLQGAA